ncbi:MAG: glutamine synthetase [Alphaproteobacteria bacterium]|nr:MAG: glutamine synthetase [Alphaproteobacteria bacterium]
MSWLDEHPEVESLRIVAADLNGQARGKRVPRRHAREVLEGGARFPLSVMNLDITGADIEDSPLVFASGDADGVLRPTGRGPLPIPWLETPAALQQLWMFTDEGAPFAGDPRHALARVLERYAARGLTPVVATEMEFYLIDDSGGVPMVPKSPRSGKRRPIAAILSMQALDAFDSFFNAVYAACDDMEIPADAAISEAGPGQFEINLKHQGDALRAADDAWLFKLLLKGLARRHGFAGSFMAKPYAGQPGSGLHVHFSVLDREGRNIFDNGGPEGSEALRHAVAGCLAAIPASTLVFAPHANSYERLVPGAHAPTGISWAYENRTAALRIPGGAPAARRIEHRVAGSDTNPYLVIAAILGAALAGIEAGAEPPAPITGNAYAADLPQLPASWPEALTLFEKDEGMTGIFGEELQRNLVLTKRQEMRLSEKLSAEELRDICLDAV